MSFSVGIVGLPNAGKSTLFKALTKQEVPIAPYPFTTIHPNIGVVAVPDERLKKISQIIKPEKTTPTIIEFIDIAGLVKGSHKGQGLGNQFLAKIRECDAILEIVRVFEATEVEHVEKTIDPKRDIEIIKAELIMKDLETLEKVFQKEGESKRSFGAQETKGLKGLELLKEIENNLFQGKMVLELNLNEEELAQIKDLQLLTIKPILFILNTSNEGSELEKLDLKNILRMNLKLETEISELSKTEVEELGIKSQLDTLILACYNLLDLVTFYTVAGLKEVRAWTIKKGSLAPEAGGKVHSDFEEKFIRAEVIQWKKLIESGSWLAAREKGWLQTVGREYLVLDGDVIEFKI